MSDLSVLGAVAVAATRVLGGRYRLIERLGRGGTSVVWRACDEALGRPVAIKLLTARYLDHASARTRILTEAQAAASLSHPHITSIYDYGETVIGRGGRAPYVVMELLSGSTLAERLHTGPLPVRFALQVCAQVAGALAAAHRSGVVHRDVKPANVMLTPTGAKVLDFGLAAAAGAPDEFRPGGEVWGTPAYLAPERLTPGEVVPASDVYGLGLLLYAALTGRRPWRAETVGQLLDAHRYEPPEPLPPIAGLPEDIAALCHRCLAKDPRDRPIANEAARVLAEAVGWRVSHTAPAWPPTPLVRVAVPQAPAVASDLDRFPTGPTVIQGRWRARAGTGRWRTLALSGSAAAVFASLVAGLWVVVPEPGGYAALDDAAGGRLGTAVQIQSPAGKLGPGGPARPSAPVDGGTGMAAGAGGGSDPTVAAPQSDPPTSDSPSTTPPPTSPTRVPPVAESPDADPGSGTDSPPPSPTPGPPEETSTPVDEVPDELEPTAEPAGTP